MVVVLYTVDLETKEKHVSPSRAVVDHSLIGLFSFKTVTRTMYFGRIVLLVWRGVYSECTPIEGYRDRNKNSRADARAFLLCYRKSTTRPAWLRVRNEWCRCQSVFNLKVRFTPSRPYRTAFAGTLNVFPPNHGPLTEPSTKCVSCYDCSTLKVNRRYSLLLLLLLLLFWWAAAAECYPL